MTFLPPGSDAGVQGIWGISGVPTPAPPANSGGSAPDIAGSVSSALDIPGAIAGFFSGSLQQLAPAMIKVGVFLVSLLLVIIGFIVIVRPT